MIRRKSWSSREIKQKNYITSSRFYSTVAIVVLAALMTMVAMSQPTTGSGYGKISRQFMTDGTVGKSNEDASCCSRPLNMMIMMMMDKRTNGSMTNYQNPYSSYSSSAASPDPQLLCKFKLFRGVAMGAKRTLAHKNINWN